MFRRRSLVAIAALITSGVVASCGLVTGLDDYALIDPVEGGLSPSEAGIEDDDAAVPDAETNTDACVGVCSDQCTLLPDSCPAGLYCVPGGTDGAGNKWNECAPGCSTNVSCVAATPGKPYCDQTRHECVACKTKEHCQANQECTPSGICANTCAIDGGTCSDPSKTCCGGLCVDTRSDIFNCNGCGKACNNGNNTCCAGTCRNTLTSTDHCGGCSKTCASTVQQANGISCAVGVCNYDTCNQGRGDCDGNRANGCECTCGGANQPCCAGRGGFGGTAPTCNQPLTCSDGICLTCKPSNATCTNDSECCAGTCRRGPRLCR